MIALHEEICNLTEAASLTSETFQVVTRQPAKMRRWSSDKPCMKRPRANAWWSEVITAPGDPRLETPTIKTQRLAEFSSLYLFAPFESRVGQM